MMGVLSKFKPWIVLLFLCGIFSYSDTGTGIVIGGKNTGPDSRLLSANYAITANFANNVDQTKLPAYLTTTNADARYVTKNYYSDISINGAVSANQFLGDGSNLYNLSASNISSGTLGYARVNTTIVTTNFNGGITINGTISANGSVINGPVAYKVITKVGAYAAANECVILVNATPVTITLPAANTVPGRVYYVKKIDTGGGGKTLTVATSGGNIDGAATKTTTTQYTTYQIISDGANWWVM